MTDVDDLHEGDDREPEEDERWAPGVVPVNLDEIEQRIERLGFLAPPVGLVATKAEPSGTEDLADLRELIGHDVPGLIADLRAARERIAEFKALEKREEWAVTLGSALPPTGPIEDGDFSKAALDLARKHKGQAWRRTLTVHPWEPVDDEAPF